MPMLLRCCPAADLVSSATGSLPHRTHNSLSPLQGASLLPHLSSLCPYQSSILTMPSSSSSWPSSPLIADHAHRPAALVSTPPPSPNLRPAPALFTLPRDGDGRCNRHLPAANMGVWQIIIPQRCCGTKYPHQDKRLPG